MAIKVCHLTSAHDSDDVRIFQKECVSIAEDASFDVYLIAPGASREEKNVKVTGKYVNTIYPADVIDTIPYPTKLQAKRTIPLETSFPLRNLMNKAKSEIPALNIISTMAIPPTNPAEYATCK